jgi:Flp pilus assembly protein TadG
MLRTFYVSCLGHVRKFKREAGTSLVEFAFAALFFLTLLFGIMAFGTALYAYHFVNNAAKSASRWAAVNGSTCGDDGSCNGTGGMSNGPATTTAVNTYVQGLVPQGITAGNVGTSACGVSGGSVCAGSTPTGCTTTPNAPGCTVQVTVSYAFIFPFPLIPAPKTATAPCTQPGICMSSTSDMVIAH